MKDATTPQTTYARPKIIVSRCLGFERCRWNVQELHSPVVEALKPYVEYITVCPEMEIGMGAPRLPIRIIRMNDDDCLVQNESGTDFSEPMRRYASATLERLRDIDGFLLKSRSPSCGLNDVKLYPGPGKLAPLEQKTSGFFAREVLLHRPLIPTDGEMRLCDPELRDQYLTRVFTLADFHRCCENGRMGALVGFQSRHKYLFMSLSPSTLGETGPVVANPDGAAFDDVVKRYRPLLLKLLASQPETGRHVNTLQHIAGYFKNTATQEERNHLAEQINAYANDETPLAAVKALLRDMAHRYGVEYLQQQSYFAPYPPELAMLDITQDNAC